MGRSPPCIKRLGIWVYRLSGYTDYDLVMDSKIMQADQNNLEIIYEKQFDDFEALIP